jgi:hypothetical protein
MIDPVVSPAVLLVVYEIAKVWLPIGTFFFGLFKVTNWVKDNLSEIKEDVKSVKSEIAAQTVSFTSEMKEQRNDFRAFLIPLLSTPKPRPARAKKNTK